MRNLEVEMKLKRMVVVTTIVTAVLSMTLTSIHADGLTSLARPVARGPQSKESVYFVMTDRFANGNPTNDQAGLLGGRYVNGFDPTDIAWWHGGDFQGLTEHLPYIKNLGFTAIWITPPVKQQYVQGESGAYHGYWGLDFTTIDPHLGTEADFKNFVNHAHALGLKVIMDVVANHTADVIKYKVGNTQPYIPAGMANAKKPAWLNYLKNYHNQGNISSSGASALNGDFYGLDDLFTEKPAVVNGWIAVWSNWITKFNIDGLRIDTFKYVNPQFWKAVIPKVLAVAKASGKSNFPIFGEVADADPFTLASYVVDHQVPSVLDFAFQQAASSFAEGGNSSLLADLFNADDAYTTSSTSAYGLATFMGNHDMGRIGMMLANSNVGMGDAALLEKAKLANALLFLLRGGPVLYYGDEKGMTGSGGDKSARQDMFVTQVEEWKTELRIGSAPIGNASSFDVHNPLEDQVTQLQAVIKTNPALRNGTQQTRYAGTNIYAATRFAKNREYVVAFNSGNNEETAKFSVSTKATSWRTLSGEVTKMIVGLTTLELTMAPRSYVALESVNAFKPTTRLSIQLHAPEIDYLSPRWLALTASVPGDDYIEVTFAVRTPGAIWKIAGTSDRRTFTSGQIVGGLYRVYLQPQNYKSGTKLEVVAIAKGAMGALVASKIQRVTIGN
jgi:alpha-amylase